MVGNICGVFVAQLLFRVSLTSFCQRILFVASLTLVHVARGLHKGAHNF